MSQWPQLIATFTLTVLSTAVAAALQNKAQGDDVMRSTKGGLAGGIAAGVVACIAFVIMDSLTMPQ